MRVTVWLPEYTTLLGGAGNDTLVGGPGPDHMIDDPGDDLLLGGAGDDLLDSLEGADTFIGGAGDDVLLTGDPAAGQVIVLGPGDGHDVSDLILGYGGEVRLTAAVAELLVSLAEPIADRLEESDLMIRLADGTSLYLPLAGFAWDDDPLRLDRVAIVEPARSWTLREALTFATFDPDASGDLDITYGDWRADVFQAGGPEADTLLGSFQADTLLGGGGDDSIAGGGRADWLIGGDGHDVLDGGEGADLLDAGAGNDRVAGGGGDDLLVAGPGDDTLDGGAGDDWLDVSLAELRVYTIDLMQSKLVDDGRDLLLGIEHIVGSRFGEGLIGSNLANSLIGGDGNDRIWANGGADAAFGEGGNDLIKGGVGDDLLLGQPGDDSIDGQGGSDTVDGGSGDDLLAGGGGADLFRFAPGEGSDVIGDFVPGIDRLALTGFAFASAAQALATASSIGGDTLLQLGSGTSVLLQGVAVAALEPGDVILG